MTSDLAVPSNMPPCAYAPAASGPTASTTTPMITHHLCSIAPSRRGCSSNVVSDSGAQGDGALRPEDLGPTPPAVIHAPALERSSVRRTTITSVPDEAT